MTKLPVNFVAWSNEYPDQETLQDVIANEADIDTEEEAYNLILEQQKEDLVMLTESDAVQAVGSNLLMIGYRVGWDGRHPFCHIETDDDLSTAMRNWACTDGTSEFVVDGKRLLWKNTGHDNPVNPTVIELRQLDDDVDDPYELSADGLILRS